MKRLFFDVSTNIVKTSRVEDKSSLDIDNWKVIEWALLAAVFVVAGLNSAFNFVDASQLCNIGGMTIPLLIALKDIAKFNRSKVKLKSSQNDNTSKSLFDDDIAEYRFFEVLKLLEIECKPVFVLDELDKLEVGQLRDLLKQLKPYLVSAAASFIAVAGQEMYYQYDVAKGQDDALIFSVFSRNVHVQLLTRLEFRKLFFGLLKDGNQLSEKERLWLNQYIDYLIILSRRIPRSFVALVRSKVLWEDDQAEINFEEESALHTLSSQILDILAVVEEDIAYMGYDNGLKDMFSMNLLLKTYDAFFTGKTRLDEEYIKAIYEQEESD